MNAPKRDAQILNKILVYCSDIQFTHTEYQHNKAVFYSNPTYRNAIALCLLQIGELVKNLSDDFIRSNSAIPWYAIRGMRNVVAHQYGKIDIETLWETSIKDIQKLQSFCEKKCGSVNHKAAE